MQKLYVFDLDGTLADINHRLPLIKCDKPDWPSFFRSCVSDRPKKTIIDLLDMCRTFGTVLILSGRSDEVKGYTVDWLYDHNVTYDFLLMRQKDDNRRDEILKKEMLDKFLRVHLDMKVQFIVDDRQRVVDMWRENGYTVLQCEAWNE